MMRKKGQRAATRTLHVVDADNLTAGPTEFQCRADEAARRYRVAAGLQQGDLVFVGSDLRSSAVTGFAWPAASRLVTTGKDAVDLGLLDHLVPSALEGRVSRVLLGSGDGIFAESLAALRTAGLRVEVVALTGHVSHRLYPASADVHLLPAPRPCADGRCRLPVGRGHLSLAA
jgi:hypothetical protein